MIKRRPGTRLKAILTTAILLGMLIFTVTAFAAPGTFFTTTDNENNAGTGTADGDMDVDLYNDNPLSPIEFNIVVPTGGLPDTTATLAILAWDVDEEAGQLDEVFLNGTSLGFLYGENGIWSVTLFDIPAGLMLEGDNLVRVEIDTLNPGAGTWLVNVDWGQIAVDGGQQTNARFTQTVCSELDAGTVTLNVTVDDLATNAGSYYLVSNLIIDDGSSPDSEEATLVRSASETGTTNFTLQYPASNASGAYEVVTSLYNTADSHIENLETFSFTHTIDTSPIPCGLPSTIDVVSSLNPSQTGEEVTFTATVTGSGPCPTGIVEFYDGVAYLGSGTLTGCSEASFSTSALEEGTHTIIARYLGDANYNASNDTLTQVVGAGTGEGDVLPVTGFARGVVTELPAQPAESAYADTSLRLQIPTLGLETEIVGVPLSNGTWDTSWLGESAGWLEGSAFPTWDGVSVLTGHVWDANNNPGPFVDIKNLKYGEILEIEAWGRTYTYQVVENKLVFPQSVRRVFEHEELDYLTLLTCEYYNPLTDGYFMRRMVKAVLVSVQ